MEIIDHLAHVETEKALTELAKLRETELAKLREVVVQLRKRVAEFADQASMWKSQYYELGHEFRDERAARMRALDQVIGLRESLEYWQGLGDEVAEEKERLERCLSAAKAEVRTLTKERDEARAKECACGSANRAVKAIRAYCSERGESGVAKVKGYSPRARVCVDNEEDGTLW